MMIRDYIEGRRLKEWQADLLSAWTVMTGYMEKELVPVYFRTAGSGDECNEV